MISKFQKKRNEKDSQMRHLKKYVYSSNFSLIITTNQTNISFLKYFIKNYIPIIYPIYIYMHIFLEKYIIFLSKYSIQLSQLLIWLSRFIFFTPCKRSKSNDRNFFHPLSEYSRRKITGET